MSKPEIAIAFSNGEFENATEFIADNAIWEVIGEDKFVGKNAIIENCNQVGQYFKSVTTNFKTLNVISEANKVVVNGTAEFIRDGKRISFVSACDLYEFNELNQISKITSYCIEAK
jgi:hypothetical protein